MSRRPHRIPLLAAVAAAAALAVPAAATEVRIFQTDTQSAFLAGDLEGISVDPLGRLRLADRVERLTAIDEPFLLSAASGPHGWVVGTGNAGRVLHVGRAGKVEELFAADEPEVFAVWVDRDGTVFAGSSPDGKVYRIPKQGEAEEWFDPGETYIWALARAADGSLLVATGTQGRLYRVSGKGQGEVVYDSDDTHLRSLAVLASGEVMVGTAGEGLVQLLTPGPAPWKVRTLYDADEPEVVALTEGPDGTRYAAVVASEASLVDLSKAGSAGKGEAKPSAAEEDGATVTVTVGGPEAEAPSPGTGSRRAGFSGPRSELLAIRPAGVVESLWKLDDETVFDLLWQRGRLWVATGLDGKLYSWNGAQMVLEKDVDERQVVALLPDDPGPAFATTNAAALYRVAGGTEHRGTYTSAALDAEEISRFGTFRWRGEVPPGAALEVSFRSGISAEPDRTWSEWTPWTAGPGPAESGEVGLGEVPPGRYAQWRARLSAADGASPLLYGIELTYRQENLRPRIARLQVLEPGKILVPANFNPTDQTFEPASSHPGGIFRTLEPAPSGGDLRLKALWKLGYRTLAWDAEDDNGDDLAYRLSFRPAAAGGGAAEGDGWLPMADDLDESHYSFDARALPDGIYRFRLEASDRPDNPAGEALVAERVSEPVVVDHTAPALVSVEKAGPGRLRVVVADALSPLTTAEVSRDAAEWQPVAPADGLLDGRREAFLVDAPPGAGLLLLRLEDAAYNGVAYDLLHPPHPPSAP